MELSSTVSAGIIYGADKDKADSFASKGTIVRGNTPLSKSSLKGKAIIGSFDGN